MISVSLPHGKFDSLYPHTVSHVFQSQNDRQSKTSNNLKMRKFETFLSIVFWVFGLLTSMEMKSFEALGGSVRFLSINCQFSLETVISVN